MGTVRENKFSVDSNSAEVESLDICGILYAFPTIDNGIDTLEYDAPYIANGLSLDFDGGQIGRAHV